MAPEDWLVIVAAHLKFLKHDKHDVIFKYNILWANLHLNTSSLVNCVWDAYCGASGCLLLYISLGVLHHPENKSYSRTETRDTTLQRLFWHLRAAGSWDFLPAAMSQITLSICCLRENAGSVCSARVCLFARSASVYCRVCVCLCSLRLISVKKLGRVVCTGPRSNYGQPWSPNALPYCTLHLHQPDIPAILQKHAQVSLTAPARCVLCAHWPWRFTKEKCRRSHIFGSSRIQRPG